jgi:tRNA 2-thiocytidine biosynthesis protein TtcA
MIETSVSITKRISAAIYRYDMIAPGDKVLVAVSGGKDSMTLLAHLHRMAPHFPIPFTIKALHIKTDFCNCFKKNKMEATLEEWGIDYEILPVNIVKRLKPGQKMNCYWCSTQRRTELLKYAQLHGFKRIALGHHMDDIIETFFMNMVYKGELATMLPALQYDNYPQSIIRPMALVPQADIVTFAEEHGLTRLVCGCPYTSKSKRKDVRGIIAQLADGESKVRENIFAAMSNPNLDYLPKAQIREIKKTGSAAGCAGEE